MTSSKAKRAALARSPELVDVQARARIDALGSAHGLAHLVVELAGRVAVLEARLDAAEARNA